MKNPPIVLFVAEGLTLSTSWKGNLLLSARPENIMGAWNSFPHTVLSSKTVLDDYTSFSSLGAGMSVPNNKDFLCEALSDTSSCDTKPINNIFDGLLRNHSALHLIGRLSSHTQKNDDTSALLAFVKLAKKRRVYRVYIHLLLGPEFIDPMDVLASLNRLGRGLSEIGCGEVASISGLKFADDLSNSLDFSKYYKALLSESGVSALTPEQAITLKKKIDKVEELPPTLIKYQGHSIGRINNFDSIIFCNSDSRNLTKLILTLSQKDFSIRGIALPKFLTIATPFQLFDDNINNIKTLFGRDFAPQLYSVLSKSRVQQFYFSDSSRQVHFNYYLNNASARTNSYFSPTDEIGQNYFDQYEDTLKDIYSKLEQTLKAGTYDFIFIDLPSIYHALSITSFSKAIANLRLIDRFFKYVQDLVFSFEGAILFTSINPPASSISKNNSYLPFVFLAKGLNKPAVSPVSFQNQLMFDLLSKKYGIIDIAPTILDLFKISNPPSMSGKSLLDSKVLH